MITFIILILSSCFLFLFFRLFANWPNRNTGCDAFNILLCARDFRARRRLPITVPPVFELETREQWYPPGFIIFCSIFPEEWLRKNHWYLNHFVDFISFFLMFYFVAVQYQHQNWALLAVACYAMSPGLLNEFSSLNTRPFGLALFNLFLLTPWLIDGFLLSLTASIILGILIFYSHKLTIQQLWFLLPVLSVVLREWQWLFLLGAIYLGSFAIWPSGFKRLIAAHTAIIRFWHHNWVNLGAHQVRQSSIYGDGITNTSFYQESWLKSCLSHLKDAAHQNYFILPVLATVSSIALDKFQAFCLAWILTVYFIAFIIHFIPFLRGIGMGRQYFKFALIPSLILIFSSPITDYPFVIAAIVIALVLQLRQYIKILLNVYSNEDVKQSATSDTELNCLLDSVIGGAETCTMTIPVYLADFYAYKTLKPVYWGTHSDVFNSRLNNFFPILRLPLRKYLEDGATHLLLDTRYAEPSELKLRESAMLIEHGPYQYYSLDINFGKESQ